MAERPLTRWKEGSIITLVGIIFIAILAGINLIIYRFPGRVDLTEGRRHTLSAQSQNILKNINQEVWIRAFFQEGHPTRKKAKEILDNYATMNPKIHYQFIDPDRQPSLAQKYGVRTYGTLVLESAGRTQSANTADEEGITNALLRLSQQKAKKVVFTTGHGERSLQETQREGLSFAKGILEKENYRVEEQSLLTGSGLPADAGCLVIAGPRKPFMPVELEDLKKYLAGGGKVFLLLEPFLDAGLKEWVGAYGLTLGNDIIIDQMSRAFGGDYLIPMAGVYGQNPITEKFKVATFFPTARSLDFTAPLPQGITTDVLVQSSQASWGETNKAKLEKGVAAFDEGQDKKGPLNLAVLITIKPSPAGGTGPGAKKEGPQPQPARLAVFGDSDFASNGYFNQAGNGDLFLNTINFLTEEAQLISIRPAKSPVKPLTLSAAQGQAFFWIPLVLIPLLMIFIGVMVWRQRRKAR